MILACVEWQRLKHRTGWLVPASITVPPGSRILFPYFYGASFTCPLLRQDPAYFFSLPNTGLLPQSLLPVLSLYCLPPEFAEVSSSGVPCHGLKVPPHCPLWLCGGQPAGLGLPASEIHRHYHCRGGALPLTVYRRSIFPGWKLLEHILNYQNLFPS